MVKTSFLSLLTSLALAAPALAEDYLEYPAPAPFYPFQRSIPTGDAVVIPPYRHLFAVRVYTTPQKQPYYNVPPYAVVTPY